MMKKLNIIFDFDSTLVKIEGIDELAKLNGIGHEVKIMTEKIMNEGGNIEETFKKRLEMIKPKKSDLLLLADIYEQNLTHKVVETINALSKFANIFIVSGGYLPSIFPVATKLGFSKKQIYANDLIFDKYGNYVQIAQNSSLWKQNGKLHVIQRIKDSFPGKTILIGDGHSDLEAAPASDEFICFTGVVHRHVVAQKASYVFDNLERLTSYIKEKYEDEKI